MAFQEAGSPATDDPSYTQPGLPGLAYDWQALKFDLCPRSGGELVEFEHIDLFKCTCGFKIPGNLLRAMRVTGFSVLARGYRLGNYYDESPF